MRRGAKGTHLARLDPPTCAGEPEVAGPPVDELRPRTGLILLVPHTSMDLPAVVQALAARGLRSGVTPIAENVIKVAAKSRPRLVILEAGADQWRSLLRYLDHRDVPVVLLGTRGQLAALEPIKAIQIELFLPADPTDVAGAAEMVLGPPSVTGLPSFIDLDRLYIDVRTRQVRLDGNDIRLRPKEFEILVQLALQPGVPIPSEELLRRLWPGSSSATIEDVHNHISRLRQLLGDRDRDEPFIGTRRGFGYVLNLAPVKVE